MLPNFLQYTTTPEKKELSDPKCQGRIKVDKPRSRPTDLQSGLKENSHQISKDLSGMQKVCSHSKYLTPEVAEMHTKV